MTGRVIGAGEGVEKWFEPKDGELKLYASTHSTESIWLQMLSGQPRLQLSMSRDPNNVRSNDGERRGHVDDGSGVPEPGFGDGT